jgi:hypothetical protein
MSSRVVHDHLNKKNVKFSEDGATVIEGEEVE